MRRVLAVLAAAAMLAAGQVHAGALAPAPQIIAEYDRGFIERSGAQTFGEMLDTGIIRYFFTGGRNLLILVNGRRYATTAHNLDSLPLSAVERIEVLRAESLGTFAGHAAVRGAFNLVLRKDLDGFDVRTVARMPTRDGGDARQGSVVWGGGFGEGGHLTVGVDILDREEIAGSTREHSRSEWAPGGSFAEAKNVSVGGNTVYVFDTSERELRAVALGKCDRAQGYAGPLSNPPGIDSGDKGCGFAYGDFWWDTASYDQRNAILSLDHPLGERARVHMDANVTHGRSAFRYAPSVDVFSVAPGEGLLDAINESARKADPAFEATGDDIFSVGHRFIGHGNRDWRWSTEEYDLSARVEGRLAEGLGYDGRISAYRYDGSLSGDTFVDAEAIRHEIEAGRYDLTDPLAVDPDHQGAIERSSLREEEDVGSRYLGARLALEGAGPGIGGRDSAWTAGVELAEVEAHRLLAFRAGDGRTRDVNGVLGSGGTSYAGERDAAGAFAEVSVPVADTVDVRAAGRADEYDDVGGLRAWRLGAEYRPSDIVTLRGSWSAGDDAPSMHHLHSTASQDHPYVRCIPESGPPPRKCDTANYRQVTRRTSGNTELEPSGSERFSIGAEARRGPFYLVADWYWLTTSELPGQHDASWAMLNHPECPPGGGSGCIERAAGDITIHDSFENIVKTEVSGVNTRFGARAETGWGFVAMRGFWRYVTSSEEHIAGEERPYPLPRNAVRIVTSVGRGDLTAFWAVNYRDEIESRWGDGRFNSWTGHDVTLDWRRPLGLENVRLTAGVYNVTDAKLSTNTANPSVTDGPRAAGWGRTLFVTLNLQI
ncbi:MAG: TonB-dependent receptor [Immundisolibacterales bacterium]|nr:TonB-dependent receptor [Immundisolibacterales bacterium]